MNNEAAAAAVAIAIPTLSGTLIDNFSWGVLFALVTCVLMFAAAVSARARALNQLREAQAAAEAAPDLDDYGA